MTKVEELRRRILNLLLAGAVPTKEDNPHDVELINSLIAAAKEAGAGAMMSMFTHEVLPHCAACIQACASGSKFTIDYVGKGLGLPIVVDNPKEQP